MKTPLAYLTVAAATLAVMTAASLPEVALKFGGGVLAVKTASTAYARESECQKDDNDGKWVLAYGGSLTKRKRYEMRKQSCDGDGNYLGYALYQYWPAKNFMQKDHWAVYRWGYVLNPETQEWEFKQTESKSGTVSDFPNDFPERPK